MRIFIYIVIFLFLVAVGVYTFSDAEKKSSPINNKELKGNSSKPKSVTKSRKRRAFTGSLRTNDLEKLLSTNENIRRQSFELLYNNLTSSSGGEYLKYGKELHAYLAYVLSDPNDEFSHFSAASIYQLAVATSIHKNQGIEILKNYPYIDTSNELKFSLIDAIQNSPNKNVKALSAKALVLAYEPTENIEDILVEQFQNNSLAKSSMLIALSHLAEKSHKPPGFYNESTKFIIINAIKDGDPKVSRAAVEIVKTVKLKDALPILIEKLKKINRPSDYRSILTAFELQKENSKMYITDIEEIMNNSDNERFKSALYKTLSIIKK